MLKLYADDLLVARVSNKNIDEGQEWFDGKILHEWFSSRTETKGKRSYSESWV